MTASIEDEAKAFIKSYATLFSSPAASSSELVAGLARRVGEHYRPGLTMFTNGKVARFESQAEAASLIESEMRNNIATGLGTKLVLEQIERIDVYSDSSTLCWLTWSFHPATGSEFEGRSWKFMNIYGYRAESAGCKAGWEFVVRDQEVNEVMRVTGKTFED